MAITQRRRFSDARNGRSGPALIIVIAVLLAPIILLDLTFLLEIIVGLPRRTTPVANLGDQGATIVVPAHNEARVIGESVDALKDAAGEDFPILVVADNCIDDTADIASRAGVIVIERFDLGRRGKGHALAFARQWLRQDPPSAVIVLDADCRTDRTSLVNLAARTLAHNKPSQALNLLEPSLKAEAMVQVSTFAFLVKNLVRQRGLQRLTGGVHLTGTGMCLTWDQFDRADLATSNIVEDLRLGLEMTRDGASPQLIENAFVWSAHASMNDTLAQRSRWEGGFLSLAGKAGPDMLLRGLHGRNARTLFRALDLLVPPLTLLAMVNVAALVLAGSLAAIGVTPWAPVALLSGIDLTMAAALLASWWFEGRTSLSAGKFLSLPLYAVWKVPLYLAIATKGAPSEWRRTRRRASTLHPERESADMEQREKP